MKAHRHMMLTGMGLLLGITLIAPPSAALAQAPTVSEAPTRPPSDVQSLNQPVPWTMTCREFTSLMKSGDKRTGGLAILWLDGFYSGRSGLTELPASWTRTVAQGIGGPALSA